jgi:site-specific recombinase XerD
MQIDQARTQYIRWLLVTRDLSPHTIRAYDGDLATFERYVGARFEVEGIDRDRDIALGPKPRDQAAQAEQRRARDAIKRAQHQLQRQQQQLAERRPDLGIGL